MRHVKRTARKTPCYKCEKRTPGCHGSCEEFLQQQEARKILAELWPGRGEKAADDYRIQENVRAKERSRKRL